MKYSVCGCQNTISLLMPSTGQNAVYLKTGRTIRHAPCSAAQATGYDTGLSCSSMTRLHYAHYRSVTLAAYWKNCSLEHGKLAGKSPEKT